MVAWYKFTFAVCLFSLILGTFSNENSKENVKNPKGLFSKTTTLDDFLYISLPSPHNYDMKMLNFTCVNKRRRIFLSLSKLECGLHINSRKIRLHLTFSANWNKLDRVSKKREFIFKVAFSLPSPSPSPSAMLKLPILIGGVSVSIALPYTAISRKVVGKKCARDNPER